MKTKLLVVTAALVGAATLSAHAGIFVSFRLPFPPIPVPVVTVTPPTPVVVAAPAPVCTTLVTVVTPACPGPDYVWVPGYWSGYGPTRVWVAGCWQFGPTHFAYNRGYAYYGRGGFYGGHRR